MKKIVLKKGEALMLRTCASDGTSYGGFKWPKKGAVKCDDWQPVAECGHGLHGLLWGQGDGSLLDWSEAAAWLVVRVTLKSVVKIDNDKVKVPGGVVEYFGDGATAVSLITPFAPAGTVIVGGTEIVGDGGTAIVGDGGTAIAGDGGTATAGDGGTATVGYGGTATVGYGGCISILYWNGQKYRRACFEVGEDGIEPDMPYTVDEKGKAIKGVKK